MRVERKAIEKYVRKNPGAPFILFFIGLLCLSALQMVVGNLGMADAIAVYAYLTLVIGIILQVGSLVFNRGGQQRHAT